MNYTTRKLKVYYRYNERLKGYTKFPEIRMHGKWLKLLGFTEGRKINVETFEGKLIIRLIDEDVKKELQKTFNRKKQKYYYSIIKAE